MKCLNHIPTDMPDDIPMTVSIIETVKWVVVSHAVDKIWRENNIVPIIESFISLDPFQHRNQSQEPCASAACMCMCMCMCVCMCVIWSTHITISPL